MSPHTITDRYVPGLGHSSSPRDNRVVEARAYEDSMKEWLDGGDTPAVQALKRAASNPAPTHDTPAHRGRRSTTTITRRQHKAYGPMPDHLTPNSNWGSRTYTPKRVGERPTCFESFAEMNRSDASLEGGETARPLFPPGRF